MRWWLAGLLLLSGCAGRPPKLERGEVGTCTRVQSERAVRGQWLCEAVWTCVRPPGGTFDRVGLRRIATCDAPTGPLVVYLPGMHMNGEVPFAAAGNDIKLYLAQGGFRVWSVDYRTHAVPPEATPEQLTAMSSWTSDTFADDIGWGMGFIRGIESGPLFLMGFSYGAGLTYRVAARNPAGLAGLVILDGMPPGVANPSNESGAIDVGSSRLPYERRQQLLGAVKRGPDSPSPIPGYATAGAALTEILYSAPSFGGQGGLSNAKNDVSDPQVLATLLAGYDRWWPRAASGGAAVQPSRTLPVLAFTAGQMGEAWNARVRAGAQAFGGTEADVRVLPKYGHLDVLVAMQAARDIYEPARAWMLGRAGRR
jgi:pimeloyl-ACP methyl ester carboxylesterase